MKNKFKFFMIIALFAVIGFTMAACSSGNDDLIPSKLVGSWKYNGQVLFIIKADGTGSIGNAGGYNVNVLEFKDGHKDGNSYILPWGNVSFNQGSTETGRFEFSLNGDGAMWIQYGTGPFAAWANIGTSPYDYVISKK